MQAGAIKKGRTDYRLREGNPANHRRVLSIDGIHSAVDVDINLSDCWRDCSLF